jgi:hypothetical protein
MATRDKSDGACSPSQTVEQNKDDATLYRSASA